MPLSAGARIGPYEIVSLLGAGGMGEVYRARDATLGRDIALKILPELFANDPERLARFEREAKTLAALNHPHIAQIYGFETDPGTHHRALVMEFVEGEDLAERLRRGPIPIDETLPIAIQIADALEAAHGHGIIHRDLKPANIKVRPDGTVKVLDFGLAKALESSDSEGHDLDVHLENSPTITSPAMTVRGMILGTAAYMAPEQAKGHVVDKRADIWAFGAVLFEMLTGRPAFKGDSTTDTMAAVLKTEPDWTALPRETPPAVATLLRRCLAKDRSRRLADIADARLEIEDARAGTTHVSVAPTRFRSTARRTTIVIVMCALFAIAGLLIGRQLAAPASRPVTRTTMALPASHQLGGSGRAFAISRDGSRLVYVTNRGLYVRSLDTFDSRLIPGTDATFDAFSPAFSPDGQSIAFLSTDKLIVKTLDITTGKTVTLNPGGLNTGGILPTVSWDESGVIVAAGRAGVLRFASDATEPEVVASVTSQEAVVAAHTLPDGDHLLMTVVPISATQAGSPSGQVVIESVKSHVRKTIVERGNDAKYIATGHIGYVLDGVLRVVPFDARRLEIVGPAASIVDGVRAANVRNATANFAVSDNGTLVYLAGPASPAAASLDLAFVDRTGRVEHLNLPPAAYEGVRVSPDGGQIAFSITDGQEANVWIYDLTRTASMRRLTFGGRNRFPVWSADGKRIAYQSDRDGDVAIFWQSAAGNDIAQRLTTAEAGATHMPESFSPSGRHLLFTITKDQTVTLWSLGLSDQRVEPFGDVSSTTGTGAVVSPDGEWVAYGITGASRQSIVFVQPFPATGAKYQVSRGDDGHHPIWSPDGTELFFVPGPGQLLSVKVTRRPSFSVSSPIPLYPAGLMGPPAVPRNHDITRDGQRFIGRYVAVGDKGGSGALSQIQVVTNWFEDVRARAPVR